MDETYSTQQAALAFLQTHLFTNPERSGEKLALAQRLQALNHTFVDFILQQGLSGFWLDSQFLENLPDIQKTISLFQEQRKIDAARYLAHLSTLLKLHDLFESNGLRYAVMKGAHSREILYANPSIRSSVDVDVLIEPTERFRAVQLLVANGCTIRIDPNNISHEISIDWQDTSLDLHWDIFRPGRIAENLATRFLDKRIFERHFYTLSANDELFLLLIHSVFAKYLSTPHSRLCTFVDIYFWSLSDTIDWRLVVQNLICHKMTVAAWLTCRYMKKILGTNQFDDIMKVCEPGTLKKHYLQLWLDRNLMTKFMARPIINQIFFTLPAHDTLSDVLRALWNITKARYLMKNEHQIFLQSANSTASGSSKPLSNLPQRL